MFAARIAPSSVFRRLVTAKRHRMVATPKNPHLAAFCTVPKKKSGFEPMGKARSPTVFENKIHVAAKLVNTTRVGPIV